LCEAKAPLPLPAPKPIGAKRNEKVSWSNPVMSARLAAAYADAGNDDEKSRAHLRREPRQRTFGQKAASVCRTKQSSRGSLVARRRAAFCFEGTINQPRNDP
jgi:hypothetical protein